MSRYFCIFQSLTKKEIGTEDSKNVKTVSKEYCTNFLSDCTGHFLSSNGQYDIQSECIGHRLKNTGIINIDFPTNIIKGKNIESKQYNTLIDILLNEIDERLASPLYWNVRNNINNKKRSLKELNNGDLISKKDMNVLNNNIGNQVLYQDTASVPKFSNLDLIAKHDALEESMTAIQTLIKDCICYSDCNGYSLCYCYGNCNHY